MTKLLQFFLATTIIACGSEPKTRLEKLNLDKAGPTSVILLGVEATPEFRDQAAKLGVSIEGETIMRLKGDSADLNALDIPVTESLTYTLDTPLEVSQDDSSKPDVFSLYQAKKDFGLLDFWKELPLADGRGVIVGVIDDGISPNQSGFQKTTTGERKFIHKQSQSSFTTYEMTLGENEYTAVIAEGIGFQGKLDLNLDGKIEPWAAKVSLDGERICLDLDVNHTFDESECKGGFTKTGDYFTLPKNRRLAVMAEVNIEKRTLKILPAEMADDSHGEGVASVMAGYRMGNITGFDGVAPGSQIVDYDLSEDTNKAEEREFTLGTFLLAFDYLARHKVEVVNVSYSFFFTNVQAQVFMARAINKVVEKHNMVISFSAGNNGPALGSLNRRLIYPPSVLVVGAFVSKELDERVHGVTGLPEEGRVVYYSSRGPGAGAGGPLMIAPLSSLTHGAPETGFRAFSGTSSASPAMAGAAAVLISAIKQEGLKVHAATVIHAMRLSAKRLKNEPFISQGYGLPQIKEALSIYKELISGEKFLYVNQSVNKGGLDGTTAQGIFARKSQDSATESYRIQLSGVLSALAPVDSSVNLVIPVKLEYSRGIKGPSELWVSSSNSRLYVDVELDEVLAGEKEGFGEIRIISQLDKSLMSIIPVTVIHDHTTKKMIRESLSVNSQEGSRLHLNVPEGVVGLKVRARMQEGEMRFLNLATFNPDYIRTKQYAFTPEFFIPTPKSGHYQITLLMPGGSDRLARVEFEVEEIGLKLLTQIAAAEKGKITVSNSASVPFQGVIKFQRLHQVVASKIFTNKDSPEITMSLPRAFYSTDIRSTSVSDLSYLYANCSTMEKNPDGSFIPYKDTASRTEGDNNVTLRFRCVPFEFGIEATDALQWQLSIFKVLKTEAIRADIPARAKREMNLPNLAPGTYQVSAGNIFAEDEDIFLARIEIQ